MTVTEWKGTMTLQMETGLYVETLEQLQKYKAYNSEIQTYVLYNEDK